MDDSGSLFAVSLISENVIKSPRPHSGALGASVLSAGAYIARLSLFDPGTVRIDQAAGGFGTVIEVAAKYCMKEFDRSLAPGTVDLDNDAIAGLLSAPHAPFISPFLNQFREPPFGWGFFVQDFVPTAIEFQQPHQVLIKYEASVGGRFNLPRPQDGLIPVQAPHIFTGDPYSLAMSGTIRSAGTVEPRNMTTAWPSVALREQGGGDFPVMQEKSYSSPTSLRLGTREEMRGGGSLLAGVIGTLRFQLTCPYSYVEDQKLRRVDVFAVLSSCQLTILNKNDDITRLADAGAFGNDWSLLKASVLPQAQVKLIPTVSMVGRSIAANEPFEFEQFDVAVFHVTHSLDKRQAMVVALNLKPGSHGLLEDVVHFIGDNDFGVITDEFRTERLFKYKWRTGGFFRQFPLSHPIQVQRDKNPPEEATLNGDLSLDTLDVVSYEIDANTEADVVRIAGSASVHADYLELNDGTKISPPDINFGDPKVMPWAFATAVGLELVLVSQPLLRQFQIAAYYDAFQYISRPFAEATSQNTMISYTRTQSVSKQMFSLGNFVSSGP